MSKDTKTTETSVEVSIDKKFLDAAEAVYISELAKSRLTKKNIDPEIFQGIVTEMAQEMADQATIDDLINSSNLGATKRNVLGTVLYGIDAGWCRYTSSDTKYVKELAKSLHAPQFAAFLTGSKTLENVKNFISWYSTQKG